ncbi:MAG: hypothetical protein NTY19_05860 [Planctomycetota bacterium]|nr:hypothetical protein [Planctomycetota bacterium]
MHSLVLNLTSQELAIVLGIVVLACMAGGFLAAAIVLPRTWCWLGKHLARTAGLCCICLVSLLAAQGRITADMVQGSGEQLVRDVRNVVNGWPSFLRHQDEGVVPADEAASQS